MNEWIIYTKNGCVYCEYAKNILTEKNFCFKTVEINDLNKNFIYNQIDPHTNNYRYFPIIFYNKKFIGGYTELKDFLDKKNDCCKHNELYDSKNEKCIKNTSKRALSLKKSKSINHYIPTPLIYKQDIKYKGSPYYSLLFMIYLKKKFPQFNILIPDKISTLLNRDISHEDISLRWNQNKKIITYPPLFWDYLKLYYNQNKRFIVFPFGFSCDSGGHANYMIYDNLYKSLERFEPYGTAFTKCIFKNVDKKIKKLFTEKMGPNFFITYKNPLSIDKYKGFQTAQANEEKNKYNIIKKNGYKNNFTNGFDGFCTVWCIWYIDLRLSNPDINRKKLIYDSIFKLDVEGKTFTNFIYDYAQYLLNIIKDY